MNRTRALALGIAAPTLLVGTALAVAPAIGSQGATTAVGTWQMSIDPRPVATPNGPVDPPAFPSLVSLNRGGTVSEAVSSVPGPAVQLLQANGAGGGLGAWRQRGDTLHLTFTRFLTRDGVLVGWQQVSATGTVSASATTQVATATFYRADGTRVGPVVTLDVTGARMNA